MAEKMPPDVFAITCRERCKHCAAGNPAKFRADTKEWTHTYSPATASGMWSHTLCLASVLRNEQEEMGG